MSSHSSALTRRTIALAALTQAVYLVDRIARKGQVDADDCRVLMESIFADHSDRQNASHVYGQISNLDTGIRICRQLLQGGDLPQAKALMVYSAGLISLQRRLAKSTAIKQTLADGMQRIAGQRQYFGDAMHDSVIAAIAELYGDTISTMKPRIIIRGKPGILSQSANTQRIRALLMAGLRAAHLWHHNGGGHLSLLLKRKALLRELERLQTAGPSEM